MQMTGPVSPIKGASGAGNDGSKDLSYSLIHDKVEIEAINRFHDLKDANIRRQADMQKLRAKLQNLQSDFKIYQTSNKIKLQNIQSKIGDDATSPDAKIDSSTRGGESGLDCTIDSDQMINDQITASLEMIRTIEK